MNYRDTVLATLADTVLDYLHSKNSREYSKYADELEWEMLSLVHAVEQIEHRCEEEREVLYKEFYREFCGAAL